MTKDKLDYVKNIIKLFESLKEYNYLRNLFMNSNRTNIINKIFIFNTIRSFRNIFDRELFLGKILALNGAKVIILLDDGILNHWDTYQYDHFHKNENFIQKSLNPYYYTSRNRFQFINKFLKNILLKRAKKVYIDKNLRYVYYSDIISKDNLISNFQILEKLQKYAKSSTIRFFKTSELDFNNKYVKYYYLLSLQNALLSYNVGNFILNHINPDYFITSHGIYSTWGPAYDYMRENNSKSFVYAGKHSHTINPHDIYFTDAKVQTLSRSTFWKKYKNREVTNEMEEKVKRIFKSRIYHSTKDTLIYYNGDIKKFEFKKDLMKCNIGIFPNLIWDGNIEDRHKIFKGIIEWLTETINFLKDNKGIQIFLKFHPAETTIFKNSPQIQNIMEKKIDIKCIKNLKIIPSDSKINTYKFLKDYVDFGIVYDGILALEMPFLKIPTLLGGYKGRFSVNGGNFTVSNKKEYFKHLENVRKTIELFHKDFDIFYKNIIRYSYWYFYKNVLKLPTLSNGISYGTNLLKLRLNDIELDNKLLEILEI
ncbi:MAG: hypothetical protein GF311_03525 [Candidatus Lokiarchaeota archaeon]|nr:hypothetical protein [Candidatus Lokiarchaeota archaeon]